MWSEFKKFILRGNVMDLAVGVVMGSAFTAIVNGMVNDLIMPVIGYVTAGVSFSDLKLVLSPAEIVDGVEVSPEVAIAYGHMFEVILNFLIISLCVFIMVKVINTIRQTVEHATKKQEEEAPAPPPQKPDDVLLLEEIRDLLKKDRESTT